MSIIDLDYHPSVVRHTVETPTTTTAVAAAEVGAVNDNNNNNNNNKTTKSPKKELIYNDENSNINNNNNHNKRKKDDDKSNNPPPPTTKLSEVAAAAVEGEEEDPITPTSDEFKIPAPRSPPPAPRKRRCGVTVACRKKLDFLDHKNHPQLIIPKEEVLQEFFAASFDQIHSRTLLKRRCPCI